MFESALKKRCVTTLVTFCCMLVLGNGLTGCVSRSRSEAVARSQKGYYPQGCVVQTPEGDKHDYIGATYVLSDEAYRALFLGE